MNDINSQQNENDLSAFDPGSLGETDDLPSFGDLEFDTQDPAAARDLLLQLNHSSQLVQDESKPLFSDNAIDQLKIAVQNEELSNEVLSFRKSLVNELKEVIDFQLNLLDDTQETIMRASDLETKSIIELDSHIRKMEAERINYMLRAYIRARLFKIQKNIYYYSSNEDARSLLSEDEISFAKQYKDLVSSHFHSSFFRKLPVSLQKHDEKDGDVHVNHPPRINNFVFCRFLEKADNLPVRNGLDAENFTKDATSCIRYDLVKDLIEPGFIVLL